MKSGLALFSCILLLTSCSSSQETVGAASAMSLDMHTWTWVMTSYNDDSVVEPNEPDAFTLSLDDGKYNVSTDCNGSSGSYELDGMSMTFSNTGVATLMFCDGSQEGLFLAMLPRVQSYLFSNDGQLILELEGHTGSMIFR